jgi:hypothetical protein
MIGIAIGFLVLFGLALLLAYYAGGLPQPARVALWCLWGLFVLVLLVALLNYFGWVDVGFYHHDRVIVR